MEDILSLREWRAGEVLTARSLDEYIPKFRGVIMPSSAGTSSPRRVFLDCLTLEVMLLSKRREPLAQRHSVTSQTTRILMLLRVRVFLDCVTPCSKPHCVKPRQCSLRGAEMQKLQNARVE